MAEFINKRLIDVSTIIMGVSPKGETYNSAGVGLPLLNGPTEFGYSSPICTVYTTDSKRECEKGDLIFCVRGSTTGRMNWADRKYSLGRGVCTIRGSSHLETKYIRYCIEMNLETLLKVAGGGTFPNLSRVDIEQFIIPFPTNRFKIAAILSAYDDLIENNTRRIAILEEMAQSLYREWFVHFRFPGHEKNGMVESELGLIPEGWEAVKFTDVADVLGGGTPKTTNSEYWNGSIPFFTPKDSQTSFYVIETEKSLTEVGLKNCSSRLYPKNTVFITARGTVGKVVLNSVDMAMNQSCYALQGRNGIDQYSVFLCILNCIDQLKQNAHGAVFDTIITDTFRMLQVIKPPLALANVFCSIVSPIFETTLNLLQKNANLRKTRDLLLPRLIGGEVDVEGLGIVMGEGEEIAHI